MTERPIAEFPLRGAGGEPISFVRTICSHGVARLAPASIADDRCAYRTVLLLDGSPRAIVLRAREDLLTVSSHERLSRSARTRAGDAVRRMFRLDDDLSPFYRMASDDATLSWAVSGAGRLLASPTVFEDIVKTICTTNCAWSGTVRMTNALVELGGGAFPEPALLAKTKDAWFKDVARMGYRGPYVREFARMVVRGAFDPDMLLPNCGLGDEEVEERLLALPGVGPYAKAHIMQLLGRHRHLILDSWTRPTYLRLTNKKRAKDTTIERAFQRYGTYAGLAFWLFLTRDWIEDT